MSILRYPDPALRRRATPVESIDDSVRAVALRMIDLMHEAPGIGLAAPQVGLAWRLFVAHVPKGEWPEEDHPTFMEEPKVYINPVISDPLGPLDPYEEGCLSLPDIHGDVLRPHTVTIEATDLTGERFSQTGSGLLARCWQHEFDHLDGILIIDRMVRMHKLRNRSAIRSLERSH